MAAGVVPQSSCSLSPMAPARIWSTRPSGADELPLPVNPKLSGMSSVACNIMRMCVLPGVHVVALVPVFGPVPPPIRVVIPEERPWKDDGRDYGERKKKNVMTKKSERALRIQR